MQRKCCVWKGGTDPIRQAGKTGGSLPSGNWCLSGIFIEEEAEKWDRMGEEERRILEVFSGIREGRFGWSLGYHRPRRSGRWAWKFRLMPV